MTGDAAAVSPLARRAEDLQRALQNALGTVEVAEIAFPAQVDVRTAPEHALPAGLPLPLEPNRVGTSGATDVLWLGPDEWLVVGPPGAAADIAGRLGAALRGVHHSIVDVSAARAVLELRGPGRRGLLAKGCALDLEPPAWAPGRCAQTLLAGVQVLLQELADSTRVFVRPSFGDYVVDWLVDATEEYRLTGAAPEGAIPCARSSN